MFDDGRGYPLLVEGKEGDSLVGELLVLQDPEGELLRRVDEIEGAGGEVPYALRLYRREKVEVKDGIFAWLYVYNGPVEEGARMIRDWVDGKTP